MKVIVVTYFNDFATKDFYQDVFTNSKAACEKVIFWLRKIAIESEMSVKDFDELASDAREQLYYGSQDERKYSICHRTVIYREYEISDNKMPPY